MPCNKTTGLIRLPSKHARDDNSCTTLNGLIDFPGPVSEGSTLENTRITAGHATSSLCVKNQFYTFSRVDIKSISTCITDRHRASALHRRRRAAKIQTYACLACEDTYTAVQTARFRLSIVDDGRNEVLTAAVGHGERDEVFLDTGARHEVARVRAVHVAAQTAHLHRTPAT